MKSTKTRWRWLRHYEDGYEVAVKELVDAKIHHLPIPKDEIPQVRSGNVINLLDALRKSLGGDTKSPSIPKKSVASEKTPARKGIGLVKSPAKSSGKRKSA